MHFHHGKLDRRIDRHINPELGPNPILCVLEDAVSEAVTRDVGRLAAGGQQCRRPEAAAFFVADVEAFPARIAYGIVGPRSEPELVRISAPCVRRAALRHDRSERTIRYHVYPWCRRHLIVCRGDDVFAAIWRESAETVEEDQFAMGIRHRFLVSPCLCGY